MPTPFYHISIAQELLNRQAFEEPVSRYLQANKCAFLLGNTAPDVQVISGEARETTHFFLLPIRLAAPPPWEVFLTHIPNLKNLSYADARWAFLGGYLCHLQADWLWIVKFYEPIFGPSQTWGSFSYRLYLHNVLRAYQDAQIFDRLQADTAKCLAEVEPGEWLPFVKELHLIEWRNNLAAQLQPGAEGQTVNVFAERQGVSPKEFTDLLSSKDRLQKEVFSKIPEHLLEAFKELLIEENIKLLQKFYQPLVLQ